MTVRIPIIPLAIACALALVLGVAVCPRALAHFGAHQSRGSTPAWLGDVPGLGAVAPDRRPSNPAVELAGCTIANPLLKDDPARVRRFVPPGYALGKNGFFGPRAATIIVAYMACDDVRVGDGAPAPAVLSLIAIQVVADPIGSGPADALYDIYNRSTLNFLPSSSWYLLAAQTDHAGLASRLQVAGLPVEHTPGLVYHSDYAAPVRKDGVAVPSHDGDYRVTTRTMVADVFTHNHDWFFWHGAPAARTSRRPWRGRTGFFLHLHAMDDSSCGYHLSPAVHRAQPACGAEVTAPADSPIATFLGAPSRRTPYAFNHPPSHARGYIDLPPSDEEVRER